MLSGGGLGEGWRRQASNKTEEKEEETAGHAALKSNK
jgi:hypothetical protein